MKRPADLPPRLEIECLKALWALGEGNVQQVREVLISDRQLAYTTVMTVLDRLTRRNAVERRKVGRSFVYVPVLTQSAVRERAVRDLIDTFFAGSEAALRDYLLRPPELSLAATAGGPNLETSLL